VFLWFTYCFVWPIIKKNLCKPCRSPYVERWYFSCMTEQNLNRPMTADLHFTLQPIPSRLCWPITFNAPDLKHYRLTNTIHFTLKMTSAQVFETSVTSYPTLTLRFPTLARLSELPSPVQITDRAQSKPFTVCTRSKPHPKLKLLKEKIVINLQLINSKFLRICNSVI